MQTDDVSADSEQKQVTVKRVEIVEQKSGTASAATVLKIVNGALECLWGFPFLGGTLVVSFLYIPLILMFIMHLICLILAGQSGKKISGPLIGVIGSVIGWIPFVGFVMHILAAVFNLVEGIKDE